jgi:2,3-bisphosphoglycerate-independent phosphoglycerate mutase
MQNGPIVLTILDGWGLSPSWGGNAISMNNPVNMDNLWKNYPHTVLQALSLVSRDEIVGDSRLGHTLIGAGRDVLSNYSIILKSIENRSFFRNETLLGAINWAKKNNSNLHLMGLVSEGGVHAHISHLLALLKMCHEQGFTRVYIDMITDGTDSLPTDALRYIEMIENKFKEYGMGQFASVGGRYYGMDRDENWERITQYYNTITGDKKAVSHENIRKAITSSYEGGLNDEYVLPCLIRDAKHEVHPIKSDDAVVFFNFREDRARQLTRIFVDKKFKRLFWKPKTIEDLYFATFISYQKDLTAKIVFTDMDYKNTLSEIISKANKKQLKIAESQKYAHVTYFFNGGAEDPFVGEERKIVSSLNVDSYDKVPAMSAPAICEATIKAIKSNKYDLIVLNFANVDMIAHTGNIIATGQAVQILDKLIQQIVDQNLKVGGTTIITADHGHAEQMVQLKKNLSSERETSHTLNPVPFILIQSSNKKNLIQSAVGHHANSLSKIIQAKDTLADIAPTILELMQVPKPADMTGHSLLSKLE